MKITNEGSTELNLAVQILQSWNIPEIIRCYVIVFLKKIGKSLIGVFSVQRNLLTNDKTDINTYRRFECTYYRARQNALSAENRSMYKHVGNADNYATCAAR